MTDAQSKTIILDTPIEIGAETISEVTLRKPHGGELRGLSLALVGQADYNSLEKLLPRITTPVLHPADVARLDPADLMEISGEVMDFLLRKAVKAGFPTTSN